MAKSKKDALEDDLAIIRAIRNAPEKYDLARDLAPFLQHKSNHAIAAAAETARDLEAEALTPALSVAFKRLIKNAGVSDPGCKALIAIASGLATLGAHAPEVYLAGIEHVQREASFGPPVDVAAPLRGVCARGLVRMNYRDALLRTVEILADREIPARVGAVRALADSGSPAAELALRLKVLQSDDLEVVSECFTALLFIEPERSVEFVARYLTGHLDELVESAALALGESRLASALPPLQRAYASQVRRPLRKTFLLAMAMLRKDEALEFLLARLEDEPESAASDALAALALYRSDDAIVERARAIVARRDSPLLSRLCGETLR